MNTWNGLFPPQALAALCRGVAQYEVCSPPCLCRTRTLCLQLLCALLQAKPALTRNTPVQATPLIADSLQIQQHPNSAQQQPSRPAPPHPAPHQFQYPAVPLQHPAQNIFAPGMPQMPAYPSHVPRPYAIPGQPSLPPHPIAQYPVVNSFHSMGQAPQAPALLNAPSPPRSNAPLPASAQLPADQVPQIGSSTALASLLASLVQAGSLAVPGPPAEQPRQPSSTPPPATPQTTADIPSSGALSPEQVKRLLQVRQLDRPHCCVRHACLVACMLGCSSCVCLPVVECLLLVACAQSSGPTLAFSPVPEDCRSAPLQCNGLQLGPIILIAALSIMHSASSGRSWCSRA